MNDFATAVLSLAACTFAASASAKLSSRRAYRAYRAGLREAALVPARLLPVTAAVLAVAETLTAAGLASAVGLAAAAGLAGASGSAGAGGMAARAAGPLGEFALAAATALAATLAAGVMVVMRRDTRARCACFGASSARPLGARHLARNLTLLVLLVTGLVFSPVPGDHPAPAGTALAGTAVALAAGAAAALLVIRWDDLADLLAPVSAPAGQRPGRPVPPARSGRAAR